MEKYKAGGPSVGLYKGTRNYIFFVQAVQLVIKEFIALQY